MGGGIDGDLAGNALVAQVLQRIVQGGVVGADLSNAVRSSHHDVVAQEVLVGGADVVLNLSNLGGNGFVLGVDVVDVVNVGAVAAVGGVEAGCAVQTGDDLALVVQR